MKIVIYGQARTGTTALFYRLKQALPTTTRTYFEPHAYQPEPRGTPWSVLVKMLTDCLPGGPQPQLDTCRGFGHTVMTLRDPRDRLISALLFRMHWQPLYVGASFAPLMTLLEAKEREPASVPVWRLFEGLMAWQFGLDGLQARAWLLAQQQAFFACHATRPDACVVRYEEMIEGRLPALKAMLGGLRLDAAPIAPEHRAIYRAGGAGEWRQWFLAEDIAYFQDIFQGYLLRYEYPQEWMLAASQVINPCTSSRYVKHWRRVRWRERWG